MPEEKPPKRPPGRRPSQTFYTTIGFHLTPKLHDAMKTLAVERGINLADVYREATEGYLNRRGAEEITYWAAPLIHSATRVNVPMADELCARMRAAARSDSQALVNAFETAVRLYLASLQRPGF